MSAAVGLTRLILGLMFLFFSLQLGFQLICWGGGGKNSVADYISSSAFCLRLPPDVYGWSRRLQFTHRLIILKPPVAFNYSRCPFLTNCVFTLCGSVGINVFCLAQRHTDILSKWLMSPTDTYLHVGGVFFYCCFYCCRCTRPFPSLKLRVFVCLLGRACPDPPARRERTETSEPW